MKKQVSKNIAINFFSFLCNVLVGILLTPYLVSKLGVVAYGLIPMAMIFTDYINVITQSITSSINRLLTVAIEKKQYTDAKIIFSTALSLMTMFAIFQFILVYYPILNLDKVISIPDNILKDAKNLFILVFANFSLSLVTSVLSVSMYATNRLDIMQSLQIVRAISRVLFIVILFLYWEVSLTAIGIASVISGIVVIIMTLIISRRLTPELKYNLSCFDLGKFKEISAFGGWILVNQLGFLLLSKVDLIILNRYVGLYEAGVYSAIMQIINVVKSFALVFAGVTGPMVMIYFANQDNDKIISVTKTFIGFLTLSIAVSIAVVVMNSYSLMEYWLGETYSEHGQLLSYMLMSILLSLGMLPIFSVNVAIGKVKIPALFSLFCGLLGLTISYYTANYTQLGVYSVVLGTFISLTLKNAIFSPLYVSQCLGISYNTFFNAQLKGLIMFAVSLLFCKLFNKYVVVNNMSELFLVMLTQFSILIVLSVFFYDKKDKSMLTDLLKNKVRKNE
ncbi:oligosaccharide flippase family protein [Vibrio rarus]|uniref:oligosaccharide flippase family protein n=1 Tax=Vibrio rarus TaxID=413403 RepID=UPI0021C3C33A|nr:oligosaccharide flippase family protein [Vibrio rarus]